MCWRFRNYSGLALVVFSSSTALAQTSAKLPAPAEVRVEFERHVKPILEAKCFGCHGPTVQQSGLRLDRRQNALRGGDYGVVIVPGKSAESKLILRLVGADFGLQMPPTGPLAPEEIALLRAWIDQGADFPLTVMPEGMEPASKPIDPKLQALLSEIRKGNLPAVRKMLEVDAALLNARDPNGATPLMHAALYAGSDMLRWLLERGADPNAKSRRSGTALHWGILDISKVRILLERGVDVNAKSADGRTALLLAASQPSNTEIVQLLLEKGADANTRDIAGRTALMAASGFGNTETMRALIAKGADVNAKTDSGSVAIMDAARSRNVRAVQMLIDHGADVNARTKRNGTAVAGAASYGSVEIVKFLVDKGARIDVTDERGYSPLMYAAYSESMPVETVRLLLSKGADPKLTGEGETALSLAHKRGNTEIVQLLRKAESPAAGIDPAATRTAVQKSLALLEKTSPQFIKRGGCNSCHNQFLPAMAQALARERGIPVGKEIAQLPLAATEFSAERAFELIAIGGANGVGYSVLNSAALKQPADQSIDASVHYLQSTQEPDGRWKTTGNRPPMTYDDVMTTAMALRALQLYTPDPQRDDAEKRIERAAAWLREANPQSNQECVFHLLGLAWTRASRAAIEKAVRGLLAQQRPDGSWAQLADMESDAYATGQALYALNQGGAVPPTDPAYRRGLQYLLRTQALDGSWHVKTRSLPIQPYFESGFPYGHDQWISAAGTSWATMALALSVPPQAMN